MLVVARERGWRWWKLVLQRRTIMGEAKRRHPVAKPHQTAVIVTAIDEEYCAVRECLRNAREEKFNGMEYLAGEYETPNIAWDIAVIEVGQGNPTAALLTDRAIQHFKPQIALLVGVAGGVKDVKIGDVVVANKVYDYGNGADEPDGFKARPESGNPNFSMGQIARRLSRDKVWLTHLPEGERDYKALYGPIAAGSVVVKTTGGNAYKVIKTHYNDSLVIEKEGKGFLDAVHSNESLAALVIRGVSDLLDKKEDTDLLGSKELASKNASAFAMTVLDDLSKSHEPGMPQLIEIEKPIRSHFYSIEKQSVTLEILDGTGEEAYFHRQTLFTPNVSGVNSFAYDLFADGMIDTDKISVNYGAISHVIKGSDGRYLVLTNFRTPLDRGRQYPIVMKAVYRQSFMKDKEYWSAKSPQPRDEYVITIRFPPERLCKQATAFEATGQSDEAPCSVQPLLEASPQGGNSITWTIKYPNPISSYRIEWDW